MERQRGQLDPGWRSTNIPDGFKVAVVGDLILSHPVYETISRTSPELVELLHGADLVVGNLEGTILDLDRFGGHPEAESGFSWLVAPPSVGRDLARLGFHALSRANNHATDWGVEGMLMTDRILRESGIAIAGTGTSLGAARAPGYVEGRTVRSSLVSWATTFERNSPAADGLGAVRARPGASTLGYTPVFLLPKEHLEQMRDLRDSLPGEWRPEFLMEFDQRVGLVTVLGKHYTVHPDPAAQPPVGVHFEMDAQGWKEILRQVRQAKQTSDFTVAASHSHEPVNVTATPPDFLPRLAREAIAEGADLVCGHGPHQLRGIEVVDGRPVFYSLGDFSYMENTRAMVVRDEWERRAWRLVPDAPSLDPTVMTDAEYLEWSRVFGLFGDDIWFESVVAVVEYGDTGRARRIELHPIELGNGGRDSLRGIPRLAAGDHGQRILDRLARLSAPLGTEIRLDPERGIGVIEPR
jgi:poly-gamma-glutamate synthesis protein (capsule biosynthesis protein)